MTTKQQLEKIKALCDQADYFSSRHEFAVAIAKVAGECSREYEDHELGNKQGAQDES